MDAYLSNKSIELFDNPFIIENKYLGEKSNKYYFTRVKEIIEDLKWALSADIWNISRKNSLSNGLVNIKGL